MKILPYIKEILNHVALKLYHVSAFSLYSSYPTDKNRASRTKTRKTRSVHHLMTIEWYRRFEDCSCQPFSFTGKMVKNKRFVNDHIIMNHSCVLRIQLIYSIKAMT